MYTDLIIIMGVEQEFGRLTIRIFDQYLHFRGYSFVMHLSANFIVWSTQLGRLSGLLHSPRSAVRIARANCAASLNQFLRLVKSENLPLPYFLPRLSWIMYGILEVT